MLELIFQGFIEWTYGLILECWEYFSSMLLNVMSMDFAYLKERMPVIQPVMQTMLALGWALLIGNLVFQAVRSMMTGLGFEAEDPKLLFGRTFVFSFLLVASPQICNIALNMTSTVINMLEIPDAVDIKFADKASFAGLSASWLLVVICGIVVMFQSLKLILEMAERYFILAVLTITSPLAFGMGGSRSTSDIFAGWCRMYGSMCLLTILNVMFVKILLSVLSFYPSGVDVLPWMVLVLTVVKVAKKADAIVARIGLNPAMTGDSLGRFPGALSYMVMRSIAGSILHSAGRGSTQNSRRNPNTPASGPHITPNGPTPPKSDGAGSRSMGSVNVNSNQNTTAQQSQNTQFGAQQSSVNEYVSGNGGGNNAYDTRRTSVPLGTRRAPSHTRPTVQTNPPGTQGTNPANGREVKHGTAGMPAASGGRVVQNAGHVDQSGSAVNKQRSPGTASAGNRVAVGNGPRFTQREAGNARRTNRAEHGTTGTVQSSEQNNVAIGAARVSSSVNAVTQNPTQQGPGNTHMTGQSPTIRAQSSGSSTEPRASARPEARQGRNAPSSGQAASPKAASPARRGIDISPPSMADLNRPAQSFTAQQKDRPPRQQNPTLHHGTAGIAPPTAISPDKQENKPARASSREEAIGMIPMTPEDILDLKGGGDNGRAEE
ncbi:MAG: hypothetical protein IJV51_03305 [Oscillospiraceae bacterium]|nr:hypothetical protein [Oscillospiraceae bacterium]